MEDATLRAHSKFKAIATCLLLIECAPNHPPPQRERNAVITRKTTDGAGLLLLMMLLGGMVLGLDYALGIIDTEGIPFFEKFLK